MEELTEYEKERAERIARNATVLQQLQLAQLAAELSHAAATSSAPNKKKRKQPTGDQPTDLRRSSRSAAATAAAKLKEAVDDDEESAEEDVEGGSGSDGGGRVGQRRRRRGRTAAAVAANKAGSGQEGAPSEEYEPDSTSSGSESYSSGSTGGSGPEDETGRQRGKPKGPPVPLSRRAHRAVQTPVAAAAAAAPDEEDPLLLGEEDDWELQQALALSLVECQAPAQQQQEEEHGQQRGQQQGSRVDGEGPSTSAASGGPTTGYDGGTAAARVLPDGPAMQQPGRAKVFVEDRATAAAVAAALAPMGYASRARWRKRQQQQEQQQQQGEAGAGVGAGSAASGAPGEAGAKPGQPPAAGEQGQKMGKVEGRKRAKKLPIYNPSPAEVQGCFELLATQSGGRLTSSALLRVATSLGQELDDRMVRDMLQLAADRVPGLAAKGSSRSSLTAQDFQKIVDHFRVAE